MCGIAGAINFKNYDMEAIKASLYHRGPDEQQLYTYNNIALFHTRLSIQDIHNGHQPFHYEQYSIVFNGEIYNHLNLRKELREFHFQTTSDTETLLYMYIKYKEKMFEKLDGMFAFAILDKVTNSVILARDRSGKKPLYLYKDANSILFASELNGIRAGVKDLKINKTAIESYLRCGFFFETFTPYENVITIEAGHCYTIDFDTFKMRKKQYFDIKDYYQNPLTLTFDDALIRLDELLHISVKDRLESSDLEVGAFLSGGIDSSLVVAIASKYKKNIKTFTVKFDGSFDESYLAKLTATQYNTEHYELPISMNLKDDIETILSNYGQPFMDSSAIPSYYVAKEAKKYVTVILNGDGADELFGGYRRYVPSANGLIGLANTLSSLTKILPKPHKKQSLYNYGYRLLSMAKKDGLDFYLSSTNDIFEDVYSFEKNIINDKMDRYIKNVDLEPLSQMLYLDFKMILFSDLLVKMDIATMSQSLEGRSPFLSKYILEFAPRLQNKYKIKGKQTKYILRELAKKYIPNELITQPKRGFEVPLKKWVNDELKENIYYALHTRSYSSSFVKQKFINDLLDNVLNISSEKRAKMLWTLYCLEMWKKNL